MHMDWGGEGGVWVRWWMHSVTPMDAWEGVLRRCRGMDEGEEDDQG